MSSTTTTTTKPTQEKVILYDIPTKKPQYGCWSPNVWKTRLVLNYKSIPYTTKFLLHSEIPSTLQSINLPPNVQNPKGPPTSPYTVPAVLLPDGSSAMDSALIAPKLEAFKPEPSLHLENKLHEKIMPIIGQTMLPLLGVLFPRIGRDVLLDEVVPGWRAKREKQFGMSIEEFEAAKGGEKAWEAAKPGFEALGRFMREHKVDEGPFLLGSQVCYGDFIVASLLESSRRIGEDIFERIVGQDEALGKLHEACKEWYANDR